MFKNPALTFVKTTHVSHCSYCIRSMWTFRYRPSLYSISSLRTKNATSVRNNYTSVSPQKLFSGKLNLAKSKLRIRKYGSSSENASVDDDVNQSKADLLKAQCRMLANQLKMACHELVEIERGQEGTDRSELEMNCIAMAEKDNNVMLAKIENIKRLQQKSELEAKRKQELEDSRNAEKEEDGIEQNDQLENLTRCSDVSKTNFDEDERNDDGSESDHFDKYTEQRSRDKIFREMESIEIDKNEISDHEKFIENKGEELDILFTGLTQKRDQTDKLERLMSQYKKIADESNIRLYDITDMPKIESFKKKQVKKYYQEMAQKEEDKAMLEELSKQYVKLSEALQTEYMPFNSAETDEEQSEVFGESAKESKRVTDSNGEDSPSVSFSLHNNMYMPRSEEFSEEDFRIQNEKVERMARLEKVKRHCRQMLGEDDFNSTGYNVQEKRIGLENGNGMRNFNKLKNQCVELTAQMERNSPFPGTRSRINKQAGSYEKPTQLNQWISKSFLKGSNPIRRTAQKIEGIKLREICKKLATMQSD